MDTRQKIIMDSYAATVRKITDYFAMNYTSVTDRRNVLEIINETLTITLDVDRAMTELESAPEEEVIVSLQLQVEKLKKSTAELTRHNEILIQRAADNTIAAIQLYNTITKGEYNGDA